MGLRKWGVPYIPLHALALLTFFMPAFDLGQLGDHRFYWRLRIDKSFDTFHARAGRKRARQPSPPPVASMHDFTLDFSQVSGIGSKFLKLDYLCAHLFALHVFR